MDDSLEARIDALERTLMDGDQELADLTAAGDVLNQLEGLESTVSELEDRVAELEAATQAMRGYIGNVKSVNEEVEDTASLALSKVEALESQQTDDSGGERFAGMDSSGPTLEIEGLDDDTGTQSNGDTARSPNGQPGASPNAGRAGTPTNGSALGASGGPAPPGSGESTSASPGGSGKQRCEACGRPDSGAPVDTDRTPDSSATGGGTLGGTIDDPGRDVPTPEDADDLGTLQRIRNML